MRGYIPDSDMINERYHVIYIHNIFGNFLKDMLTYFTDYLYPRFNYKVIGVYDKAVEYISKKTENGREIDREKIPAFILNPTGDMDLADANSGARQPHRFPNYYPGLAVKLYDAIYQDANTIISPGFSRIKGELELIMLFASFYEYADVRLYFIQQFRGLNTIFYPIWFNSYIILPEDLINYEYSNEFTGVNYKIDWLNNGAKNLLIKTTNRNELVYPCTIRPQLKMTSMSDGSERYGGTDNLASWRLNATVEYEVELPTYLILKSDYLAENLKLNLTVGSMFSNYDPINNIPEIQIIQKRNWDLGLDSTSNSIVSLDDATSVIHYSKDFQYKDKYIHTIDASQTDTTSNIEITLPIQVNDENELIVRDKYGIMDFNVYYEIVENGTVLKIFSEHVKYALGDIIELFYYKQME